MFRSGFPRQPDADAITPDQIEPGSWLIWHGPTGWFYQNQISAVATVREELANFAAWNGTPGATNFAVQGPTNHYRVDPYRFIGNQFAIPMPLRRGVFTLLRGQAQRHLALAAGASDRRISCNAR